MLEKTEMELKSLEGSRVNPHTLSSIMKYWGEVAEKAEALIRPDKDEIILWKLVYQIVEPDEDDESWTPQSLITAQISMIGRRTRLTIVECPVEIGFNIAGMYTTKNIGLSDKEIIDSIVSSLKNR